MFIGIKDGKVWDICSEMINARISKDRSGKYTDEERATVIYIEVDNVKNIFIGDSWDFENNINIEDSPKRNPPKVKTREDLLEEKISELEARIKILEEK